MKKDIIDRIRNYYSLPKEVSDEQIAHDLKDSFGAAIVNLNIATEKLQKALIDAIPTKLKKFLKKITTAQ